MFNITFGTNTEGRPLGVATSIDSNVKVFTPFRVFMMVKAEINRYFLRCSCPFYSRFGIPYRHVHKFLLVTKHCVNISWWKSFVALYHCVGSEKKIDEFHKRMYYKALSISCNKYYQCDLIQCSFFKLNRVVAMCSFLFYYLAQTILNHQ